MDVESYFYFSQITEVIGYGANERTNYFTEELMKRRIKKAECFKAYFIVYVKNCYILVIVDLKMYRFGG